MFFRDARKCFRLIAFYGNQNQFVFIGDARIKSLYQAFVEHFQQSKGNNLHDNESTKAEGNLEYVDYKLRLKVNYIFANEAKQIVHEFEKFQKEDDPPNFIVASSKFVNLSPTINHSNNYTKELEKVLIKNLTFLVKPIDDLIAKKSKILWKLQDPIDEYYREPVSEWKDVTNSDIDKFNHVVTGIIRYSKAHIWSSSNQIAWGLIDEMIDGYKLGPIAIAHDIQILLNMYCNDDMNYNDGTCCRIEENYTILQIITYSLFGVCTSIMLAMMLRRWYLKFRGHTLYMPLQQDSNSPPMSSEINPLIMALGILGMIMAYFFLCDRTNFFMKENKYYSEFSFWIPVFWMSALGLFFTEDSKFTRVLHRDQTDELKGFMIIVILIYYMTGASKVIPIFMHIKVLISTFLFLSGYAHFTYFWQTGNNGIVRFLNIMFRINFMTIILCFSMNRPYQFYFFAPLLSFWYTIIYITISIPPRITAQTIENNSYQYLYLVLKFVCLFSVITILYMSEVFFERIFLTRPWKALFVSMDDFVDEWWYRWKLDRYSTAYGMVFAAIFIVAQKFNIVDDSNHGNLFSRRISLSSTLVAIAGITCYTTFTFFCKNKQDCEEIHSYSVFIPIISYIVLRNISGVLRTRFSTLFAWFGKISLELFICMCHIWLAADRHGVLVLLPGFPTLNLILTSFIFVCISHEVHRVTLILVSYVVPPDWKLSVRNFILFLVVLLPIGRNDGMF